MKKQKTTKARRPAEAKEWGPWLDRNRVSKSNGKTGLPSVNLLAGADFMPYRGSKPRLYANHLAECHGTCGQDCGACKYRQEMTARQEEKERAAALKYLDNIRGPFEWAPYDFAEWFDFRNFRFDCYAVRMTRYNDAARMYGLNTLEARENPARFFGLVESELFSGKTAPAIVRIHDSGDIVGVEYGLALYAFAARHPATRFYTYSKRYDLLDKINAIRKKPANLVINVSPWAALGIGGYNDGAEEYPRFYYDDGSSPEVAKLPHCPAVDKHGHATGVHCAQCKRCALAKPGSATAVYPH